VTVSSCRVFTAVIGCLPSLPTVSGPPPRGGNGEWNSAVWPGGMLAEFTGVGLTRAGAGEALAVAGWLGILGARDGGGAGMMNGELGRAWRRAHEL